MHLQAACVRVVFFINVSQGDPLQVLFIICRHLSACHQVSICPFFLKKASLPFAFRRPLDTSSLITDILETFFGSKSIFFFFFLQDKKSTVTYSEFTKMDNTSTFVNDHDYTLVCNNVITYITSALLSFKQTLKHKGKNRV